MRGRLATARDVGFGDRAALVFLSFACLASAAGGTLETSASRVPKSAPTLLVSFDGFRASYLDAQAAEALPELRLISALYCASSKRRESCGCPRPSLLSTISTCTCKGM